MATSAGTGATEGPPDGTEIPPAAGADVGAAGADVGASGPVPLGRLVVGFDRSAASLAALETAVELGDRLAAEIRVVHAVDLLDFPVDPDAADWESSSADALRAERSAVADVLGGYRFGWSYRSVHADPVAALISAAEECEALMIVVGARGDGMGQLVERLMSRSVGHRLVDRSGRPVLVVGPRRGSSPRQHQPAG